MSESTTGFAPTIEPVQFGCEQAPLFGIYHPALDLRSRTLTVICPPLFNEYMRTHYALRELAVALSKAGHNVLRFDYTGTGDSAGDLLCTLLETWTNDIQAAIAEGRALCNSTKVNVVAIRAGAMLAAKALMARAEVKSFVFWDPVFDGAAFIRSLQEMQRALMLELPLTRSDATAAREELVGYRLNHDLVDQFRVLGPEVYGEVSRATVQVVSTISQKAAELDFAQYNHVQYDCGWDRATKDRLMPRSVIEAIVRCSTAL